MQNGRIMVQLRVVQLPRSLKWPWLMGSDRKQQEKRTEDFSVIRWSTCSRSIYRIFSLEDKQTVEKQSLEGAPGGQNPPGRALVSCAHQGTLPGSFLFSYFSKYSKTNKKYFCGFFGVYLLTVSRTSLFSRFWSVPEGLFYVVFRCQSLDNITFNVNERT